MTVLLPAQEALHKAHLARRERERRAVHKYINNRLESPEKRLKRVASYDRQQKQERSLIEEARERLQQEAVERTLAKYRAVSIYETRAALMQKGIFCMTGVIEELKKVCPVPMNEILSERRMRRVVAWRMSAMHACKKHTARSLPDIGRFIGKRDHTTVLHAIRKIDRLISEGKTKAIISPMGVEFQVDTRFAGDHDG